MANQTITLGKDVTSIKWVNGATEFPVEEFYIDGSLVWPDANWAKNITVKNFKYRGGTAYASLMSYSPYENTRKRWYDKKGEPWPLSSDHSIYKHSKRAQGQVKRGTVMGSQVYYYDVNTKSISASCTSAEVTAASSKSRWKITGGTIPADNLPFTYGSTKGRATSTSMSSGKPEGDSSWSAENEGINGVYYPIFYRTTSRDTIKTKEEARTAFLYSRTSRVASKRPGRGGYYFTDKKASGDDFFTGIYTTKNSPGSYILLGTYYPDFSESDAGGGLNFRFEIRVKILDSEYKLNDDLKKSRNKRKELFEKNIYFEKTLTHPNLSDQTVKRVNIGKFSSPILWTTDNFPDAKNAYYGPLETSFTWEMPIDQQPWMNESFKWKEEGGSWSADSIVHTYWEDDFDINDTSSLQYLTRGFETEDLTITAVQS